MFRGNKPVLILPGILMIVMFIGGYTFLHQSDTMTNEELQNVIEMNVKKEKVNDDLHIEVNWDWTVMPSDGLYGDDYIGIALMDENSKKARTDLEFSHATLELIYGGQVIKEVEGNEVENGIMFEFPNKMIDYTSYGNVGKATLIVKGEDLEEEMVRVKFLHTWTDHSPLEQKDALLQNPTFEKGSNVPYWILSR